MKKKTSFPNVPKGFDLIALYGRNTGYADKREDCRIYHLNNETGAGTITIYHVFQGVRSTFNDIQPARQYGSDLDALKQYDAGESAYWLASGISVDCSEDDINNCINLFCTENLSE